MKAKPVEEYLKMPYTIEIVRGESGDYSGWFARVLEWPGCMTQADNFEELGAMITDAMQAWVETAVEEGLTIPEPKPAGEYSGKFVVRVPKSLHRDLVEIAEKEGVSLNTLVSTALSKAVGQFGANERLPAGDFTLTPVAAWPKPGK